MTPLNGISFGSSGLISPHPNMPTIVVVDDDDDMNFAYRVALEKWFHVIDFTSSFEAARHFEKGEKVDLLITDFRMPGINGRALGESFQKAHPGMPILLVTGSLDEDTDEIQCFLQLPNTDSLEKPVTIKNLLEKVAALS